MPKKELKASFLLCEHSKETCVMSWKDKGLAQKKAFQEEAITHRLARKRVPKVWR